jgi:hypothetical protein
MCDKCSCDSERTATTITEVRIEVAKRNIICEFQPVCCHKCGRNYFRFNEFWRFRRFEFLDGAREAEQNKRCNTVAYMSGV